ncbi:hypothetical protein [Lewinella sp. IMCC34191]|uniref:hypothetical protein n=1 Tax=Lewinella sp. IMCC34191 TaxID=2259172 RepID=UPI000E274592|nr:hypothetical protein [Lewinella sp. IMCC34191]
MFRFLLLCFLFGGLSACSQRSVGLFLPVGEMVVLGTYANTDYAATVTNRGSQEVEVQIVDASGSGVVRSFILPTAGSEEVHLISGQRAQVMNVGSQGAQVKLTVDKSVGGMHMRPIVGP